MPSEEEVPLQESSDAEESAAGPDGGDTHLLRPSDAEVSESSSESSDDDSAPWRWRRKGPGAPMGQGLGSSSASGVGCHFDPTTGSNQNSPFAHLSVLSLQTTQSRIAAATTVTGGLLHSFFFYYTGVKMYTTASALTDVVLEETHRVVGAVSDEVVLLVHDMGFWVRAASITLVIMTIVLVCGKLVVAPVLKKFTWIWPSPFAQAAKSRADAEKLANIAELRRISKSHQAALRASEGRTAPIWSQDWSGRYRWENKHLL